MGLDAAPLLLIAVVAPLGALDVIYFHLWTFRLYRQPSARAETVTHVARGALFAMGALLLSSFELSGGWFWCGVAVLALDFVNSIADVTLERASRAPLGGLPSLEAVIHFVGASFAGAILAAFLVSGWARSAQPSALSPLPASIPSWLVWNVRLTAVGSVALTALELALFLRAVRAARQA